MPARPRLIVFVLAAGWTAAVCAQAPAVPAPRNIAEFDRMFQELRNWGRWGTDDQLGTINLVTPAKTREAAALVKAGVSVSLSHNPIPDAVPDSPHPSYALEMAGPMNDVQHFNYHGYVTSHIDSLPHS